MINVREKLPKKNGDYLVRGTIYGGDTRYVVARFSNKPYGTESFGWRNNFLVEIEIGFSPTHWDYLPKP